MASGCPDGGEQADGWGDGEATEQLLGEAGIQAHLQAAPSRAALALGLCGEAGRCHHELPASPLPLFTPSVKEGC